MGPTDIRSITDKRKYLGQPGIDLLIIHPIASRYAVDAIPKYNYYHKNLKNFFLLCNKDMSLCSY